MLVPDLTVDSDPRVDPLAGELQAQLVALAQRVHDPNRVSQRPAPERVCPQLGCRSTSVGVMLAHHAGGCAAMVVIGGPGETARTLVPWAGGFRMPTDALPFRQPPEGRVVVEELVPCGELLERLQSAPVEAALQAELSG